VTKPSCVLRTLTLCDQQGVPRADWSGFDRCYCDLIAEADHDRQVELASEWRWLRARAIARSAALQRIKDTRQKLGLEF
jgi:hypothetical protein